MMLQGLGDGNIVLKAYPEWKKQLVLRIIKYLNSQIMLMEELKSEGD